MSSLVHISSFVAQTTTDDNVGLGVLTWIVVGLIAGFLGSKIINKRGEGILLDIVLGLIGAVVGGFLFRLVGIHTAGSFILSIVVATVGAIVVLVVYHKVIGARTT